MVPDGCHCTCTGVPCCAVSDILSFDTIFCVVKRRTMKVAAAQVEGEAVVAWVGWVPTKNWISRRVKGVETVSVPPSQYSPGRMRNNKAI